MKKYSFLVLAVTFHLGSLASCKEEPKASTPVAEVKPALPVVPYEALPSLDSADAYQLTTGKLVWTGSKNVGAKHQGTVQMSEGTFHVKSGRLVGVKATIDMNTITVDDLTDGGEKRDFIDHMKSPDFFDTKKYPTATFSITDNLVNVNLPDYPNVIIGNLTLKGISKEIKMPAKITINGNKLKVVTPGFAVNRTDYGINFGSGVIGTVKDKIIHDFILLNLEFEATKK
jgi:polyisoprenoid-binding protein YceI